MKSIPDGSIDAIITDPPYGTTACKWDSIIPFNEMWERLNKLIKPNGAIVLFWSEPFSSALRMSNIKQYKYDWIWAKNRASNPMLSKIQPLKFHENILVFCDWRTIYNPVMEFVWVKDNRKTFNDITRYNERIWTEFTIKTKKDDGFRFPKSILKIIQEHYKEIVHPTQKPVALIEYLIRTYTNEWETVLDFTAWSWTTWVACKNTNRNYILIEKDEWYCDIIRKRLSADTL